MTNIDNLMDELIKSGIDFKTLNKAYDEAAARKEKKDNAATEQARLNVLQALRKYMTVLYGEVDDYILKEFEDTLKSLEKISKKPTSFSMKMTDSSDDEKLTKFLKALGY